MEERVKRMTGLLLNASAASGDTEAVRRLLDGGADPNSRDCDGWTALHMAAGRGETEVVRLLLAYGADVSARNKQGDTPLHVAIMLGHADAARALLEAGGGGLLHEPNQTGVTPYHWVRRSSDVALQQVVDELASPGSPSDHGQIPGANLVLA